MRAAGLGKERGKGKLEDREFSFALAEQRPRGKFFCSQAANCRMRWVLMMGRWPDNIWNHIKLANGSRMRGIDGKEFFAAEDSRFEQFDAVFLGFYRSVRFYPQRVPHAMRKRSSGPRREVAYSKIFFVLHLEGCFAVGKVAPEAGLEPATRWLTASCSTIELLWKLKLEGDSNRDRGRRQACFFNF